MLCRGESWRVVVCVFMNIYSEQPKAMTNADGSAPEDLSLDTLVAMMEDTFELMGKAMDATCQEVLDQNIPEDKRMEHVQKM